MRNEMDMAETGSAILQGSRTAPMQKEIGEVNRIVGSFGAILGTKLPSAHALVASRIGREAAVNLAGGRGLPLTSVDRELTKMLVNRNQAMNKRTIDELIEFGNKYQDKFPVLHKTILAITQQQDAF